MHLIINNNNAYYPRGINFILVIFDLCVQRSFGTYTVIINYCILMFITVIGNTYFKDIRHIFKGLTQILRQSTIFYVFYKIFFLNIFPFVVILLKLRNSQLLL